MPPQKLSDSDKQEILTLYRQSEETTTTLASRYGVSNTTISRILKQVLTEEEYDTLVQQKRSGMFRNHPEPKPISEIEPEPLPIKAAVIDQGEIDEAVVDSQAIASDFDAVSTEESESFTAAQPRQRKRLTPVLRAVAQPIEAEQLSFETVTLPIETPSFSTIQTAELPVVQAVVEASSQPVLRAIGEKQPFDQQSLLAETHGLDKIKLDPIKSDRLDAEEDFDDLDDDDSNDHDDSDDHDDLDDDDLDDDVEGDLAAIQIRRKTILQVLPLSEASIPKTFYLVVDRASELITRPLQDFAELGQVPAEEVQAKTLPIFDNHRVARRFSRRMQRVVKVPDGKILEKVGSYLQAKGITRLLIDGQVYSV